MTFENNLSFSEFVCARQRGIFSRDNFVRVVFVRNSCSNSLVPSFFFFFRLDRVSFLNAVDRVSVTFAKVLRAALTTKWRTIECKTEKVRRERRADDRRVMGKETANDECRGSKTARQCSKCRERGKNRRKKRRAVARRRLFGLAVVATACNGIRRR